MRKEICEQCWKETDTRKEAIMCNVNEGALMLCHTCFLEYKKTLMIMNIAMEYKGTRQ
jgi:hypothetical protein